MLIGHPHRICLTYTAAVVAAEYGGKAEPLVKLGKQFELSAGACIEHKQKVMEWLLGETDASPRRHGPPRPGRELRAYLAARDALRLGGFLRFWRQAKATSKRRPRAIRAVSTASIFEACPRSSNRSTCGG